MMAAQTIRLIIVSLCLLILQSFALPSQASAQLITFDRVANVDQLGTGGSTSDDGGGGLAGGGGGTSGSGGISQK